MSRRVKYLKKIIRIRKKLIDLNKSGMNPYESRRRIQEIEKYLEAYGQSYGEEYWKGFLQRRRADIIYLIPANNAENAFIKELNELSL
ncbi:MAG: hypothetical protein R3220_09980 [Balneolaceae bacterium]|nr:hypothetical protein [Balneolaceae bacterium]